jgi:hypothetical protein
LKTENINIISVDGGSSTLIRPTRMAESTTKMQGKAKHGSDNEAARCHQRRSASSSNGDIQCLSRDATELSTDIRVQVHGHHRVRVFRSSNTSYRHNSYLQVPSKTKSPSYAHLNLLSAAGASTVCGIRIIPVLISTQSSSSSSCPPKKFSEEKRR